MTQTDPGEPFFCWNAGNIVPPHSQHTGAMAALAEFAAGALKVSHIIVFGHSECGAMKGAIYPERPGDFPHAKEWLDYARAAAHVTKKNGVALDDKDKPDLLIRENALLQIADLKTHPCVAVQLSSSETQIHRWLEDIRSSEVLADNEKANDFIPVADHYERAVGAVIDARHHRAARRQLADALRPDQPTTRRRAVSPSQPIVSGARLAPGRMVGGEDGTAMSGARLRDQADIDALVRGKHIIDLLIEERARTLIRSPLWPLYRSFLYPLLKEPQAKRMADIVADMPGREAMAFVSSILKLAVTTSGFEHVPAKGRIIIASVHPTGIADGVAMYDALSERRADTVFFANRDAIRVAPGLSDLIIPVEWVMEKRTRQRSRETLTDAKKAFTDERCVVIFPSGRLACMDKNKKLVEREWMTSVTIFARKYDCAVIPTHLRARNSWLYYWFWRLNAELRDITLFNELLNKRGKPYHFTFGAPIAPEALDGDPVAVTKALREHAAYEVPAGRDFVPSAAR